MRVILESPYAGTDRALTCRIVRYAQAAMRDCLLRGEAPFASHLLYTQPNVLDDTQPHERTMGIDAGFQFREVCEKTVVYTDLGISPGMHRGIDHAHDVGSLVEFRTLPDWQDKGVTKHNQIKSVVEAA